ncbi:MAG: tRNA 2-thiouridine(34) synthase MnmA [Clostridia bacterium]|nr:tRNA 2-thiouridine(34) synthase MnmA [Clostridia bacterium]MBQ5955962.1 tRNA 2-thiouridine(34) synthase MnmA [Clostridia bacterium]
MKKKIAVGISGGVDSAVSAYLLKKQGYDVIGVFMKNWEETDENGVCTADQDFEDVRRTCEVLDIPYYSVNFSKEYWDRVFTVFLEEYKKGRTPNPDVLCNKEIKFRAFLDYCMEIGCENIATGHYCRVSRLGGNRLLKGRDERKDQSYFLCALSGDQLARVEFPVGGYTKEYVRDIAREAGIPVADKKNSTGVCFIGERNFRKFLQGYLPAQPGEIRTHKGEYIGQHIGLMYYTLGQRRGLNIGGRGTGERWFVVEKDLKNNILYVEQGEDSPELYSHVIIVNDFNFINPVEYKEFDCMAKFRYRQPDQKVHVYVENNSVLIDTYEKQRAVTPGQYAVLYSGDECLGGGQVDTIFE